LTSPIYRTDDASAGLPRHTSPQLSVETYVENETGAGAGLSGVFDGRAQAGERDARSRSVPALRRLTGSLRCKLTGRRRILGRCLLFVKRYRDI